MGGLICVALLTVALATAYEPSDDVVMLQEEKYDPSIQAKHLADVNKIQDTPSMHKYIAMRMKQVTKEELAKDFNGQAEEIAIGNTVKEMEAKHAVEAELNSEVKIDCETGAWTKFGACSKLCDGGKMKRTRPVTRKPMNGGRSCPVLENTVDCNTESCASEKYARRAARRKLTKAEKRREMAQTHMAEVHLPGEKKPRTAQSLVRADLKKAMAKNEVNKAMAGFEKVKSGKAGKH